MWDYKDFSVLVGKTLHKIENKGDELWWYCTDGSVYKMFHSQDCCESVRLDDIAGDFEDLIGQPILIAYKSTNSDMPPKDQSPWTDESYTWTFYNIATNRGSVTLRWYGTSNGYYSESVDFEEIEPSKHEGLFEFLLWMYHNRKNEFKYLVDISEADFRVLMLKYLSEWK